MGHAVCILTTYSLFEDVGTISLLHPNCFMGALGLRGMLAILAELFGRPSPSPRTSLKSESENFGL
jgi:hypothetical protein